MAELARWMSATVVLLLAGCGSSQSALSDRLRARTVSALERPDRIELLVLGDRVEDGDAFDGRERLATLDVPPGAVPSIRAHLEQALRDADAFAACYEPHHGLRLHRGADVVELSFCFHCLQMNEMGAVPFHVIGGEGMVKLRADLDRWIEAETRYRFDEDEGPMGGWVER